LNTKTVLELIGNTPLVKIQQLNPNPNVEIYLKLEKNNPGGSIKDRIAKYMIEQAESLGQLRMGQTVIEATSGNTGIGIALVCRALGYDCVIVMPESMSVERRKMLFSFGAKVLLTDAERGMDGAEEVAKEIVVANPGKYFMPNQFGNQANSLAHYQTTGPEIWRDTDGKVTHLFAGVGTTGTLMGVSKYLKEQNPTVQVIGVQPQVGTSIQGLKDLKPNQSPKSLTQNSSTKPNTSTQKPLMKPQGCSLCRRVCLWDPVQVQSFMWRWKKLVSSKRACWCVLLLMAEKNT
jgi:cysteine synthase